MLVISLRLYYLAIHCQEKQSVRVSVWMQRRPLDVRMAVVEQAIQWG